jgi:hypothetical protein
MLSNYQIGSAGRSRDATFNCKEKENEKCESRRLKVLVPSDVAMTPAFVEN